MCGIAGVVGLADERVIQNMAAALAHRGPDDCGLWRDGAAQIALGHRRLAIIDLSPAGHQPMPYARERYWIVFNGEVYNFTAVRRDLESLGHAFHSHSDTEVAAAAYAQWGPESLHRLRGMFAFAIWDSRERLLFIARDRFGIKPLLYAQRGGIFLFASELKALLASGLIPRCADRQAIWDYLSLGSIPQPNTIVAGVRALPAGHWMKVNSAGIAKIQNYWDIADAVNGRPARFEHPAEAAREARRLLEETTELHMIADVPVGAFLSGGVDSTAVVGLMSRRVSRPIKTYAVGFETKFKRYSELHWARIAAARFNTDHTEIVVTGDRARDECQRLIEAMDQPSADGVNTYFVSRAARQGVTVSLSGLGGDELLAGYPQFRQLAHADRAAPNGWPIRPNARLLAAFMPRRFASRIAFLAAQSAERYAGVRRLADDSEKRAILSRNFLAGFQPRPLAELYAARLRPELDSVAQTSYVELTGYIVNTLLRDADAMSMAHALEVRPVLLDHVLAEFFFSLPAEMKLNGGQSKRILVDALSDVLPPEIVRRQKMGFEFPLADWLAGPLRDWARAALASPTAESIFRPAFLAQATSELATRPTYRLWAYVTLLHWLRHYRCQVETE